MTGQVRGRVECYHVPNVSEGRVISQEIFTNLYKTCLLHPNMTEIARHGGLGGGALNVNYWDEVNPFNNNAWFVFRMNTSAVNPLYLGPRTYPWYMLVQWYRGDQGLFGTSPGNPGLISGITGNSGDGRVGVQFAIGIGGDQDPWNGTGTLGTSVKGASVWKIPTGGTGVLVWPRSNNVGGAHATSMQNCTEIYFRNTGGFGTGPSQCHIIMDDDNFLFVNRVLDTATYSFQYFGLYTPHPDLNPTYPMVSFGTGVNTGGGGGIIPINVSAQHGSITGTGVDAFSAGTTSNTGGVPGPNPAVDGVRGLYVDRYASLLFGADARQPNRFFNPAQCDEYPIPFMMYEHPAHYGYAGQVDFIREITSIPTHTRNTGVGDRMVFGSNTTASVKISAPWAAGILPGSGVTRGGVAF
jgi:hypothetical protein